MNDGAGLQFGEFTLDIGERVLLRNGRPVPLTPKAFDVLAVLAARPGRLVTKDELLNEVWPNAIVEESNLAYHVFALRKALGETDGERFVETVPRHGYRFVAPLKEASASADEGGRERRVDASEEDAAPPPAAGAVSQSRLSPALASRSALLWFAGGAAAAATAAAVMMFLYTAPKPARTAEHVEISTSIRLTETSAFAISPDGRRLVFAGAGDDGIIRLWVRRSDGWEVRPLPGTELELGGIVPPMFWSPDSRSVAFDAAGHLKTVDVTGGAPQTICRLPTLAVGGSWSRDGVVVVGSPQGGLYRCPAAGGAASVVTRLDPSQPHAAHLLPFFLPDGRHFLYLAVSRTAPERSGIYARSIDAPPDAPSTRLFAAGFGAAYVQDGDRDTGHLLFMRDGALLAHAFDPAALQLSGEPTRIAGPVGSYLDGAFFSASATGALVFRPPPQPLRLTWLDREGNTLERVGEPGLYSGLALAPAETRAVVARHSIRATLDQDLWIIDLPSGGASPLTFDGMLEARPVWFDKGARIIFTATGAVSSLYEMRAGGEERPRVLLESPEHKVPGSVSPDGKALLYTRANVGTSRLDVWVLPLTGDRTPYPLIRRPFDQSQAQFSPDGHSVAYVSNASGRQEVLVRPYLTAPEDGSEDVDTSVVVSRSGGTAPRWRGDSKELFFITPAGAVLSAPVAAGHGTTVTVGPPTVLFHSPGMAEDWGVSANGRRFLVLVPETPTLTTSFSLILDWQATLDAEP